MICKSDKNYLELTGKIKSEYLEMKQMFLENALDEDAFTDKFLEIYSQIDNKLSILLSGKSEKTRKNEKESREILFQRSIKNAIDKIIEIKEGKIEELGFSLFKTGVIKKTKNGGDKKFELKQVEKFKNFEYIFFEKFIGRKDVKIKIIKESLDIKKMRRLTYYIINIISPDFSRTLLISDEIGQATYVYDGIIDNIKLKNIKKGENIEGNIAYKIIYNESYKLKLQEVLENNFIFPEKNDELTISKINIIEQKYYLEVSLKEILEVITDRNGIKQNLDLCTIGVRKFSKLHFGFGTKFGQIGGSTLLNKNGGMSLVSLNKVLKLGGIERIDLPEEEIDYNNTSHINEILKIVTDIKGISQKVDFNKISMVELKKLFFGYGTKFGMVGGKNLLEIYGGQNLISLKKILKLGGIERKDLPENELDYNNILNIKEVLKVITDKKGNKQNINLNNIGIVKFRKLFFGYGTRFGMIGGETLLKKSGGGDLKSLNNILKLTGIERENKIYGHII